VPFPRPDFGGLMLTDPRIQFREGAVEQARAGIKSAHSSLWPNLSVNYVRGTTGQTELPQNPFWTFSGTLNLPIFSGGPTAVYYASVAAERTYEKASQDLRVVRNQVRSDLESAWAGFAAAEDQIQVQRAFLDASRQRKAESDIRYQSGLMSFEDWNRVVIDYVNSQTNFLRTQQDRVLAEAQWRFAKGEPL
jgi:outer membrane protein TolC